MHLLVARTALSLGRMYWLFAMLVLVQVIAGAFSPVAASDESTPLVTASRISTEGEKTRFEADLSFAVSFNVYVLDEPYRVVVDLPGSRFNLAPAVGETGQGLITGYRFGQMGADKARMVIDAAKPVLIADSFVVAADGVTPARMVIDLVETDPETFARTVARDVVRSDGALLDAKAAAAAEESVAELPGDAIGALVAAGGIPLPRPRPERGDTATTVESDVPRQGARRIVVIDPGHGGMDPGAISSTGRQEKVLALAFSKRLKSALAATGRYQVLMTREDDRFLKLGERVRFARQHKADLFIAIHADSLRSARATGATIYTLSNKASDAEAAALAEQENSADLIGGVDLAEDDENVTGILIDLLQRETRNHSVYLAKHVASEMKTVTSMTGRPLRSAGFRVLKAPDIPSVLIELGYLSNRSDEKNMLSAGWQEKVAGAITDAVNGYFTTELASGN